MGADKYMSATQICCVGLVIENKIRRALTASSSCEEGWLGLTLAGSVRKPGLDMGWCFLPCIHC